MGKINMQKVLIGGLIAGVVLNIVDYVLYGVVLKAQMAAAMQALGKPPIAGNTILWFVFLDFVVGVFLVWLYAAIRPRYGAGPATAVKAGLAAWFLGGLVNAAFMWPMGLMPHNLTVISQAVIVVGLSMAGAIVATFNIFVARYR